MKAQKIAVRLCVLLALAGLLSFSTGCTYLKYRLDDLAESVDGGLTFTKTPQIGLYWNSMDVLPFGYSNLDGWFAGLAEGKVAIRRHYNKCAGLGYAREEIAWGEFDKHDPSTLDVRDAGILGKALGPHETAPSLAPTCTHFLPHIGFVGLVWNARWGDLADFVLGWLTIDISGDDGPSADQPSSPGDGE